MARQETYPRDHALGNVGVWDGVIGGVIAGFVYSALALTINVLQNGPEDFFMPLRQIGAVALGREALDPSYDLTAAALAGVVVHVALSAFYGALFAVLAALTPIRSKAGLVLTASLYGLLFYVLNRLVVFPAAFPWFLANDPLVQGALHTFAFGSVLGLWLAARSSKRAD